ncbi:MAG: M1 family aminopeptidase, partial [Desulfobacterales bacterium]|nr:M1 family aminopeptidase [Desulfobacterales bacterium]
MASKVTPSICAFVPERSMRHVRLTAHCIMMLVVFALAASIANGSQQVAKHRLLVELFPAQQRLQVLDQITVENSSNGTVRFELSPRAKKLKVSQNGRLLKFDFNGGLLQVELPEGIEGSKGPITIAYTAVFDDPAPIRPVNADNPGYGVSATISERGSFLLAGSGWYPRWVDGHSTYMLEVTAPEGMLAVTAGQSKGHETRDGKSVSTWLIRDPIRGISLSVGPYILRQKKAGNITAATYFFSETDHLADAYLDATVRYLMLYQDLFGPYPYDKFAVVENFFPTGYGFPSYTLIGGRVLRLPFIIHTSLGHEIAHCWWGNGVLVDYDAGNWSEALTTYVADYLYKEMKSEADGRAYRQQMLRNYATLVKPDQDFALHRFQSRYNPATKTIGYDKGAMVFHMLRRQIGDEAFWGALRDIYRDRLFRRTSWSDMQSVFESRAKRSLEGFFKQWVFHTGAPQFYLDAVQSRQSGNSWTIDGRVVQKDPPFSFELNLALQSRNKTISQTIRVAAKETRFKLVSDSMPLKLSADPDADLFRLLFASEIPPAINSLKNTEALLVLLADNLEPDIKSATRMLLRSLGIKNYTFAQESAFNQKELSEKDVLLVGYPQQKELLSKVPQQVVINPKSFILNQKAYD